MSSNVFHVHDRTAYQKAGPSDLIELLPVPGTNPLFLPKYLLEVLVYAIATNEFIHLSGPTGSAKTSLIEALYAVPENFRSICAALGFKARALEVYAIEMATYETPGELYQRRALRGGTTFDEPSQLVRALKDASRKSHKTCSLIWLREIGRVHSASVQGGLLDLMAKGDIRLPDGSSVDGRRIAWVADSNYQAENDATHTLVTLDDALRRRFTVNLTLDYLSAEQEVQVIKDLTHENWGKAPDASLMAKVVQLGQALRIQRSEGNLASVSPPTIYGYLAFLRMTQALPHLSTQEVAFATLLGNASVDDRKLAGSVFNEVFGLQADIENDPASGGGLF